MCPRKESRIAITFVVSVALIVIKLRSKTFFENRSFLNFKDPLNIFCDVECIRYTFNRAASVKMAVLFSAWDYSQTESSISWVFDSARNLRKHRGLSHDAADSQCKVNSATKYLPNYSLDMQMKSWKWVNVVYTHNKYLYKTHRCCHNDTYFSAHSSPVCSSE